MNKKLIVPGLGLIFTLACLTGTPTASSDAIGTEVARKLTDLAAITKAGAQNTKPSPGNGVSMEGELPSVTPTGTPPPSLTPTVTPTVTATPTFTPPAEDPRQTLGAPNYRTDFPDATNWYLYENDYVKFDVVDHKFVMTAKQPNGYDSWTRTAWKLSNYYLEMTATPDTCSGRDRYGLVVGVPDPDYNPSHLLRFSCDGYYSFGFFDSNLDNKFHFLKDWTKSTFIYAGAGQTNRMGFKAEGTKLTFYANGHYLSELDEPSFGKGVFGLVVGSVNTSNFVVRVSEVAYWILP